MATRDVQQRSEEEPEVAEIEDAVNEVAAIADVSEVAEVFEENSEPVVIVQEKVVQKQVEKVYKPKVKPIRKPKAKPVEPDNQYVSAGKDIIWTHCHKEQELAPAAGVVRRSSCICVLISRWSTSVAMCLLVSKKGWQRMALMMP